MKSNTTLHQEQKLAQRLSQSQVRYVRMLEMNAPEAEEAVRAELEANPALAVKTDETPEAMTTDDGAIFRETPEEVQSADYAHPDDIPFLSSVLSRGVTSRKEMYAPVDSSESLYDYLLSQLSQMDLEDDISRAAAYIVGTLDANGYMTRTLQGVADDLLFKEGIEMEMDRVAEAFRAVRSLDPPGVGASGLRDCLLIQLRRLPDSEAVDDARNIVENYFEELGMKHSHRILSQTRMGKERLKKAFDVITGLNPKPGASIGGGSVSENVVPDFVLDLQDGELRLSLDNRIPELAIESGFSRAVESLEKNAKRRAETDTEYVMTRYNEAREFMKILRRRQQTLFDVITAVVDYQKEYFLTEDESTLRPMALKDISEITGLDIPTVSRATNNKYLSTPWGIFPLRHFFSESFTQGGEEKASGREIETVMKRLVDQEDKRHPLSDELLARRLEALGYDVSRRTVSKYRDRLRIPVARLRKIF